VVFDTIDRWDVLTSALNADRLPPMHPEDMSALLRSDQVKFTNSSDVDMVVEKYSEFYQLCAAGTTALRFGHQIIEEDPHNTIYSKFTWSVDQFRAFGKALPGFTCCKVVDLSGLNLNSPEGTEFLVAGLATMPALEKITFPKTVQCQADYSSTYTVLNQEIKEELIALVMNKLAWRRIIFGAE